MMNITAPGFTPIAQGRLVLIPDLCAKRTGKACTSRKEAFPMCIAVTIILGGQGHRF
jgi:hypothetical protein